MQSKLSPSQIAAQTIEEAIESALLSNDPFSIRDESFPAQDLFVNDPSQFIAALCTRRAGKTNALAFRFMRTMRKYPGSTSRYIALTRDSAKEIMWPVLQEINDRFKLNATFTESNLSMELPNKARLRLFGADMKNFIRRLKGVKSPAIALDEAQDFGPHIEQLIDDVLEPSLADYKDSWLALTGTPGPIPRGLFYEITQNGLHNYALHKWSLYQNPYMPDPKGFVERLKAKKGWDDRTPTLLREYGGQWVLDTESLLIRYKEDTNHYEQLPPASWNYILGIDIGFRDSDALAVIAWSERSPNIYLVEEAITARQDISSLVEGIVRLSKLYDISKIVMDTGGLGKKIAEELIRRHQIPIQAADKARKFENVAFLNDWLRQGKFKARKDSRFAGDSYQLQIDHERTTPDRLVVKKGFHSDIIDAVLYAFKESPAFTYQEPPKQHAYGSKEWAEEQVNDMERAAEEYFTNQENTPEDFGF